MAQKVVGRLSHPPTNWLIRRYTFLASSWWLASSFSRMARWPAWILPSIGVNTIGVCVIGVHTFHLYGWKTLFHFPEGGLPPSLSDMTQGLSPDPPLRRGVQALVSDAQLAAQVLLKRPLLAHSLSQVLPNRGYRLPHVVKGPPARIRRAVAGGERGFQRRNLVVQMLQGVRVPRRLPLTSPCASLARA